MDEQKVKEHAEAHGAAVVAGDLRTAGADLTPEGMKDAGAVMPRLPKPATSSEIVSVTTEGEECVVHIKYSGESGDATVASRWADKNGRPMIVGMSVL